MEFTNIIIFSIVVALINLDERNVGNLGLSRPIVSGLIFGFIFGKPMLGLFAGVLIELIVINLLNVGNFIPPKGAVITGIVVYLSNYYYTYGMEFYFPIILLYGLIVGHISKRISRLIWMIDGLSVDNFIEQVKRGKIYFATFNIFGIIVPIIFFGLLTFVSILFGIDAIDFIFNIFTNNFIAINILKFIFEFLPLFAFLFFLNIYDVPGKLGLIFVGSIVAFLLNLFINYQIIIFIILFAFATGIVLLWHYIFNRIRLWKTE